VMVVIMWLPSFGGDDCQLATIASKALSAVDKAAIEMSR